MKKNIFHEKDNNPLSSQSPLLTLPNSINKTRYCYAYNYINFNAACNQIKERRETNSYLYFKRNHEDGSKDYVKSKCSIRGNDVYRARVWNRHKELLKFCELNNDINYIIHDDHGHHSNILKFTLTVDSKNWNRNEFNSFYSSYFYDLFIKRIRNNYNGVVVARSFEVSTKKARGYLHFNVIVIFPNHEFPVYLHKSKYRKHLDGTPIKTWRLKTYQMKKNIDNLWDCGSIDVRAVTSPKDLAEYSLKYHLKYFTDKKSKETQDLTLSVLSLYDKRAFSFPKSSVKRGTQGFTETIINYSVGLEQTTVFFPRLDIITHNSLNCEFVGIYLDFFNEESNGLWYEIVDHPPPEVNPLVDYDYVYETPLIEQPLCVFDSGDRIDKNGVFFRPSIRRKFTKQKRFKKGLITKKKWKKDIFEKEKIISTDVYNSTSIQ